jgi:uncharacterized phage-associated protein
MPYDVRDIANYVLDFADRAGRPVSNVAINKIVYFCHEQYLLETGAQLVDAKIEAWEYGPVFRELYSEFKKFGAGKITERARKFDFRARQLSVAAYSLEAVDRSLLDSWIERLLRLSPGQLIDLAHVPGGPWDTVFHHSSSLNCGMEITDSIILRCGERITQI